MQLVGSVVALLGGASGRLLVAQPISGSTSLMATLQEVGSTAAKQEFPSKRHPSHLACAPNTTVDQMVVHALDAASRLEGTRLRKCVGAAGCAYAFGPPWASSRCTARTFRPGVVHKRSSCLRVLPHSDLARLDAATLRKWLASRTTLFKQHLAPIPSNLDVLKASFANTSAASPSLRKTTTTTTKKNKKHNVLLLVRDPVQGAVSYLYHNPLNRAQARATPRRATECDVFSHALALHHWRDQWLAFARAHPRDVLVVDHRDFFASTAQRRCATLLAAATHLDLDVPEATLRTLSDPKCNYGMVEARHSAGGGPPTPPSEPAPRRLRRRRRI